MASDVVQPRVVSLVLVICVSFLVKFTFSSTFRQATLVAFQFFYDSVFQQFIKVWILLFIPPYLYIILNLVILTIAVQSGFLEQEKHLWIDSRVNHEVENKQLVELGKSSSSDPYIKTSLKPAFVTSSVKEDYSQCQVDISDLSHYNLVSVKSEDAELKVQSGLFSPSVIKIQNNAICSASKDKMASVSRQPVQDEPIPKADVQLVYIHENQISYSSIQTVLVDEVESDRELSLEEEINARAEAFIVNFHNQLKREAIRRYRK